MTDDKKKPGNPQKRPTLNPFVLFFTQLLPLIVFIVADAFVEDVRISIACAVVFAVGQLVFTFAKSRRFEWIVLIDVALVGVLGGISIVSENDLFFKTKPAIMEGLAIVFLVALIFAPDRFLQRYFGRMLPGRQFTPAAFGMMKKMMAVMAVSVLLHIGAVLYTAFYAPRETWAMVSGPGFYLTALPAVAIVALQRLRRRGDQQ